jgi:hypothetical protein
MDWFQAWVDCQRVGDQGCLANVNRVVLAAGPEVVPFIQAYAKNAGYQDEGIYLLRWLEETVEVSMSKGAHVDELLNVEKVDEACEAVFRKRQTQTSLLEDQRLFENALRLLLRDIFNHSMVGGLTHITEELQILAREIFFHGLRQKSPRASVGPDKMSLLFRQISEMFPSDAADALNLKYCDPRWLRKLVYTFYRLVQFWLLRPVLRDDFLLLCHAEGIDLSREELDWLTRIRALEPLVPNGPRHVYHIVQVFALSAIWSDYRAQKCTSSAALVDKLHGTIENVWDRLRLITADGQHLNGNGWLILTQEARNKRADTGIEPSQHLWVDGLANLASAYLYALGVRPVAAKGRPRLAPDDPVLLVLEEVVENYYREHKGFRGCLPSIRKATLYEEDQTRAMNYLASHSGYFAARAADADRLFRSWQEKFGGERAFESAIEEARAAIETLPDEELEPGAAFAFERIAAQKNVPLSDSLPQSEFLPEDVLTCVTQLTDGPANSVGCWDTRHWAWWIVPRWILRRRAGHWLLRHVRLPLTRVDATTALTLTD